MNKYKQALGICALLLLLCPAALVAQSKSKAPVVYTYSLEQTTIRIDRSLNPHEIDSISRQFALDELQLAHLFEQGKLHPQAMEQGWQLAKADKNYFELRKMQEAGKVMAEEPNEQQAFVPWENRLLLTDHFVKNNFNAYHYFPTATYGINQFKPQEAPILVADKVRFTLKGYRQAREVLISGSFNGWSTGSGHMQPTADGWAIELPLQPGKHLYKFIVDGHWINDPHNLQKEKDGYRGFNSVYFVYNKKFVFDALPQAKKVHLTANFNQWNTKNLPLKKEDGKWILALYLAEGTYAYKFKVDNKWYLDPENPVSLFDEDGIENSYTSIGDTLFFELSGYANAKQVVLTGNFNQWNERELKMQKTATGWRLPYVLAAGAYEYKYIIDGQWLVDPAAIYTTGSGDYTNGLRIVKPNIRIRLDGYAKAEEVIVSGSFNFWDEYSLKLQRDEAGWYIDYYLAPGKHTYKFKVDGQWIRDPQNLLWEENEFGTGNSVIWMQPNDRSPAP
jgi:hypothetical protein